MYSGSTLKPFKYFDAWFGAHQKIDRMGRDRLAKLITPEQSALFPNKRLLLQFEGYDGPDGVKRKTPAQDEPWHYYDPEDPKDTQIFPILEGHYSSLVEALGEGNKTRAAFEAAWLAHGLVDGMTPAHHYPYEEELIRLRGGQGIETRTTPKEKILMPGDTVRAKMKNNWQMWGDKGLLATHIAFEMGVAVLIVPMRSTKFEIGKSDMDFVVREGMLALFKRSAKEIAGLKMYDKFYDSAWTPGLAKLVRKELMPVIVRTVTLVWYAAVQEAQQKPNRGQKGVRG